MSEPNLTSCKQKIPLWQSAQTMTNYVKNSMVPEVFREKCPCILLNNSNMNSGTYFDKSVTKSKCQNNNIIINPKKNVSNNKTKYNYDKYIGEYTNNDNLNGKSYYYIYVYYSDELLNFIENYKYANYFEVTVDEHKNYIVVTSYYKDLIKALANVLHKQTSNAYNTHGNKANNIPLYPVTAVQSAGFRKKQKIQKQIKTHRKNKIVSINKKSNTKKRISRFK